MSWKRRKLQLKRGVNIENKKRKKEEVDKRKKSNREKEKI